MPESLPPSAKDSQSPGRQSRTNEGLKRKIIRFCRDQGADLVGFAPVERWDEDGRGSSGLPPPGPLAAGQDRDRDRHGDAASDRGDDPFDPAQGALRHEQPEAGPACLRPDPVSESAGAGFVFLSPGRVREPQGPAGEEPGGFQPCHGRQICRAGDDRRQPQSFDPGIRPAGPLGFGFYGGVPAAGPADWKRNSASAAPPAPNAAPKEPSACGRTG